MTISLNNAIPMLPRWKCHKIVCAAQIEDIPRRITAPEKVYLLLQDGALKLTVEIDDEWMERFKPEVGGYLVVYLDGYVSFSPQKAFEEGYSRL